MSSIYPDAIDGYEQIPLVVDKVTPVNAASVNPLRSAIINIENTLGLNPEGTYDTVRARLDAIETGGGGSGAVTLDDLTDVDTSTSPPGSGDALVFDGTTSTWVPGAPGATSIDDLTDVDTSTTAPALNDILVWDGTNWVPTTNTGGGTGTGNSYFPLSMDGKIPSGVGIRYLSVGDIVTSDVPIILPTEVDLTAAALAISDVETNTYVLRIQKNGSTVASLTMSPGDTIDSQTYSGVTLEAESEITAYIERTVGSGNSNSKSAIATLELRSTV